VQVCDYKWHRYNEVAANYAQLLFFTQFLLRNCIIPQLYVSALKKLSLTHDDIICDYYVTVLT
jgi:hypothetical protein